MSRGAIQPPDEVRQMFDAIAPRYDLMNSLMTGWQDSRWRSIAAREAVGDGAGRVLDAATGTGGLARALHAAGASSVIGVDGSSRMLERAALLSANPAIAFQYADVMDLPFPDATFDACAIGFGLRNLPDFQRGLGEMARVLRAGGQLVVLELTPLKRPWFGKLFDLYFGRVVPRLGSLVTGDRNAYRYLPESVRAFPDAHELGALISAAGLTGIRWRYFAGRTVALHVGTKRWE